MKTSVAVIGIGEFGENHVKVLMEMPQVDLITICDHSIEKVERTSKKYGGINYTTNALDIFEDSKIEAVIIATSEKSHYELAKQALHTRKHILVEKPLTIDTEEANKLVKLAEEKNLILLPGHILRYDASYSTIKQRLCDGQLGTIYSITAKRNVPSERFALHSRTHPVFMALAHDIDIVLWYVQSKVKRVFAMEKKTSSEYENADIFFGIVEFENGIIANFETQWVLPNHLNQYLDVSLEMMTSKGKVSMKYPGNNLSLAINNEVETPDVTLWPEIFGTTTGVLRNELNYFISCVETNCKPESVTGKEAVQGIELAQMLIHSAKTGNPIFTK